MAINYQTDIVVVKFNSNVVSDAAYQIPGTFSLPTGFGIVSLATGTLVAAGASYLANDVVTLSGGTSTTTAQVKILTVDGSGHVLTFSVSRVGAYTVVPTGTISVTGGAGTGFTLTATWNGFAQQRILTLIEIMRSYISQLDNAHEAKILQMVLANMKASLKGGTTHNATTMAANAQKAALRFLSKHVIATDL